METLLQNEIFMTAAYYSIAMLALLLFLSIFELVTSYNNWEELKKGNVAVALSTAGKILGVANIFRHSIEQSDSMLIMLGWSALGFVLMLLSYFIFEFLSPSFKVDEELAKNNKAVGTISFILSVGISYVVGACIVAL